MDQKIILVNDCRELKDFKVNTINNIKNTEIKKELIKCLIDNNYDSSLYWTMEILCSCNFLLLWEIFFYMITNIINVSNVKLIVYIYNKYEKFKQYINNCNSENEILDLRNNIEIRNIFCDIVIFICNSQKSFILDYNKLNIKGFTFDNIQNFFKAPNVNYVNNYFKDNDPKELYIILNEFLYHLSEKNNIECFKWIYIYINYYNLCKKNKKILLCEHRKNIELSETFNTNLKQHPIWILWSIILEKSNSLNNKKYINILFIFFKIQLTIGKIKSRIGLLFLSISIFINNNSNEIFDKPIVKDKKKFLELIDISRKSINNIIKKINSVNKSNNNIPKPKINNKKDKINKSFQQLEILDNLMLNKNNNTD